MKLILCEKPDQGEKMAIALGAKEKGTGYYSGNGYCVSWAIGHLMEISKDLLPKEWTIEGLPIFPERFEYVVTPSKAFQLGVIKKLVKSATEVVIATDAEREGELIARLVLSECGWNNWDKTTRFWTSEALIPEVIIKYTNQAPAASNFDGMYYAALTRQHSDWLVGMNLSRLITIKANDHSPWSVGRVQTPVLKLITDRFLEVKNFKPTPYYQIFAMFSKDGIDFKTMFIKDKGDIDISEKTVDEDKDEGLAKVVPGRLSKEEADLYFAKLQSLNATTGIVTEVMQEQKSQAPPLLHSLPTLQIEANRIYKYSADETLEAAQTLYEKHHCLSYPRTDSQHLAESTRPLVLDILKLIGKDNLLQAASSIGNRVFNNAKLTDHYALIPLGPAPASLTEKERNIFNLVMRKFEGAFMPSYEYEARKIKVAVSDMNFHTSGRTDINLGWKTLYGGNKEPSPDPVQKLPVLVQNEPVRKIKQEISNKLTAPPAYHTEGTLIAIMNRIGLGTGATRQVYVKLLIQRTYITIEKNYLFPTVKGLELISKLGNSKIAQPELTGELEKQLESIDKDNKGQAGYNEFVDEMKEYINYEIEFLKNIDIKGFRLASPGQLKFARALAKSNKLKLESSEADYIKGIIEKYKDLEVNLGKCGCGKPIKESPKAWSCECGKIIWKEFLKKKLTLKNAQELLSGKTTQVKGLTGSKGKFDAGLKLKSDGKLEFIFDKK